MTANSFNITFEQKDPDFHVTASCGKYEYKQVFDSEASYIECKSDFEDFARRAFAKRLAV